MITLYTQNQFRKNKLSKLASGSTNLFRFIVCLLLIEVNIPALAQTTMLTGAVNTQNPIPINTVRLQPVYEVPKARIERPVITAHPHQIHTVYLKDKRTFWQRHPMVKGAAIGAGIGAGAGAATGLVTGRGILHGALIGAGTGAGVGVVRTSQIMKRHPIVRDIATGGLVGLGLGGAGSWHHSTVAATTGIGAAAGLGVGLFNNLH